MLYDYLNVNTYKWTSCIWAGETGTKGENYFEGVSVIDGRGGNGGWMMDGNGGSDEETLLEFEVVGIDGIVVLVTLNKFRGFCLW